MFFQPFSLPVPPRFPARKVPVTILGATERILCADSADGPFTKIFSRRAQISPTGIKTQNP